MDEKTCTVCGEEHHGQAGINTPDSKRWCSYECAEVASNGR